MGEHIVSVTRQTCFTLSSKSILNRHAFETLVSKVFVFYEILLTGSIFSIAELPKDSEKINNNFQCISSPAFLVRILLMLVTVWPIDSRISYVLMNFN
jgi:hypothetical protein